MKSLPEWWEPLPPCGGRWPEGPDEGIERSEMAPWWAGRFPDSSVTPLRRVLSVRSHLAPLDPLIRHCFAMTPSPARGEGIAVRNLKRKMTMRAAI